MNFNEIIGHDSIKKNLADTIKSGKSGHAYIFDGPSGVGKKKTAIAFARGILCENYKDDLCGECNSCRLTKNLVHPDLKILDLTIDEDGKQKASISVEAIRNFKQDVYLKPFYGGRKIYILENAEKMTTEAQNAMLKIFEEPPSYITIILICDGLTRILSTIRSRAVIYKFPALRPNELEVYLDKHLSETENKKIYSNISGGSISKMIELVSDGESLEFRKRILRGFVKLLKISDRASISNLFGSFMGASESAVDIINMLTLYTMDIAYLKTGRTELVTNVDMMEELSEAKELISIEKIYNIEKKLSALYERCMSNANYKLAVVSGLIKIWEEIHD